MQNASEALPDAVLALVLEAVGLEDAFKTRAVSRRFRRLVDGIEWGRIALKVTKSRQVEALERLIRAAGVRLAPRAELHVDIRCPAGRKIKAARDAVPGLVAACAESLAASSSSSGSGLRRLRVGTASWDTTEYFDPESIPRLFRGVAAAAAPCAASLEELALDAAASGPAFVVTSRALTEFFAHFPSLPRLQRLSLPSALPLDRDTATALAGRAPNLKSLSAAADVSAGAESIGGALGYLAQLEELRLGDRSRLLSSEWDALQFLEALARGPAAARLRSLSLPRLCPSGRDALSAPLFEALAAFPSLQEVSIGNCPPAEKQTDELEGPEGEGEGGEGRPPLRLRTTVSPPRDAWQTWARGLAAAAAASARPLALELAADRPAEMPDEEWEACLAALALARVPGLRSLQAALRRPPRRGLAQALASSPLPRLLLRHTACGDFGGYTAFESEEERARLEVWIDPPGEDEEVGEGDRARARAVVPPPARLRFLSRPRAPSMSLAMGSRAR
eukprot:tig00020943_g16280.t1